MIIRAAILSTPQYDDEAIAAVQELLRTTSSDLYVVHTESVDSQQYWLEEVLRRWCDEEELDLILTIGGTMPAAGPSAAEITPEATKAIIERQLPGFSEAMRQLASEETKLAYLDRGVTGIRSRTLIVNLPAGAAPAYLFLEAVVQLLEPTILHLTSSPSAPILADQLHFEETDTDPRIENPSKSSAETTLGALQPAHNTKKSLDPAEFAAFLQRNNPSTGESE